jgi:hypothetical protein
MVPRGSDPLMRALLGPGEPELGCEECFEQLDLWAELELAGGEADRPVPGLRAHLEGCPACAEEAASLLALLAQEPS